MTPIAPGPRSPPRRLLLSIHDVSPRHAREIDVLYDHLQRDGDLPLALLVVPDFWGEAPIVPGSRFAGRLRQWAEAGNEIFLHGSVHLDRAVHASRLNRFKSRHMTAGEGEFLGLDEADATRKIVAGRRLLEDVTGRMIAGFVAPAWLYGPGSRSAMAKGSIAIAEDHLRVWAPTSGRVLARSPVITWATRTPVRMASSLMVAAIARHVPRPRVMRVGVHPGDCGESAVMRSIGETVRLLRRSHRPSSYGSLVEDLKGERPCAF